MSISCGVDGVECRDRGGQTGELEHPPGLAALRCDRRNGCFPCERDEFAEHVGAHEDDVRKVDDDLAATQSCADDPEDLGGVGGVQLAPEVSDRYGARSPPDTTVGSHEHPPVGVPADHGPEVAPAAPTRAM